MERLVDIKRAYREMFDSIKHWEDFLPLEWEKVIELFPETKKVYQRLIIRERGREVALTISRRNWRQWGYEKRTHIPTGKRFWWIHLGWYSILIN